MPQLMEDQRAMVEATAGRLVTKLGEFYDAPSAEERSVPDVSFSPLVSEDGAADVSGYAGKRVIVWAVSHAILWYFDHATPIWEIYQPGDVLGPDPSVPRGGGCCTRYQ